MSQRIQIPINGITTTSAYTEGDTYSLVNLRPKNGALHPVAPRKVVQELSQKYDLVFVHQNNDYKNWIGVINYGRYSSVYWDVRDEKPQNVASYIPGTINSIQQIGNTISLITSDNIYYLFFQNNSYTFLGELPKVPPISLQTSDIMSHATHYFVNEYGSGSVTPNNFIDATKGLVNKAIEKLIESYGLQFFDACFVRYAFRLYDNSLTKHSPPILAMPVRNILECKTIDYEFTKGSLTNNSRVDVYGHRLYMSYDLTLGGEYIKWKDIIKSVDIFISQPLGLSSIEHINKNLPTSTPNEEHHNLIKELTPEGLKNVANTSTFYFMRSLELGKTASTLDKEELPSKDKSDDISRLDNLIFQELMSDDNFSNHKYGAEVSYAYNNRLHLANTKTTFFKGFSMEYFNCSGNYNGVTNPFGSVNSLCAEVEIQAGTSIEKVYSFYSTYIWAPKLFASSFLSYPDSRAKRMTIYEIKGDVWTRVFTAKLEPHNLLNLAYHLNNGLLPIVEDASPQQIARPDTSKEVTLSEPNKIKVSELSNPLNFPNINTYQAGNGTVLAMATNAMNVSDRNFGQYPLYVFTTQGVWTLNIGSGEVVYSSQTAPTYTEAPTTSIVCSTPFGVVFTTQRGLQIINGQSVECISPQLEEDYLDINMQLPENQCKDVIYLFNEKSFKEYLLEIDNIIYNPHESELIICDKEADYSYVLNLSSHSFYKSTERIDIMVNNIFPQLLVIGDNNLKNYATSNSPATHICLVLRPLTFSLLDIKNLERVILRGMLVNINDTAKGKRSIIMVHHSNDGVNFPALRGLTSDPCNRRDYDMGLFASSKFRQFLFSFAGIVDESSKIQFLDTQIRQEYNNTKMR